MIDLIELRDSIRRMTSRQGIYRVLKEELKRQGRWKEKPRGNPAAGYQSRQRRIGGG